MSAQHPKGGKIPYTQSMMNTSQISQSMRGYAFEPKSWENRVVLITGATGGLGAALCHRLGKAGATVILMGRHRARLEGIYDELIAAGAPEPAMIEQDFKETTPEILQGSADVIMQNFSRLDALVHTAAHLGELTPIQVIDDAQWREAFDVNVHAARDLTMACLPLLSQTTRASVLFTLDNRTSAYWGGYGVSKAAVTALTTMFADETDNLLDDNQHPKVAIHGVQPGPMRTRLRRRAFSGELEHESPLADEQAGAFCYLMDRVEPNASGTIWMES